MPSTGGQPVRLVEDADKLEGIVPVVGIVEDAGVAVAVVEGVEAVVVVVLTLLLGFELLAFLFLLLRSACLSPTFTHASMGTWTLPLGAATAASSKALNLFGCSNLLALFWTLSPP